jgi:hypothetical protein
MRIVSQNAYRNAKKIVRDMAKDVAAKRTAGLAKIAARRNRIVREDACGAYMEARYWLRTYRDRLAEMQPSTEKYPDGPPPARPTNRHLTS